MPIISDEVKSYFKRNAGFKAQSGVVDMPPKMAQITIFTASHALQGKEIRDQFDESLADLYHDLDMGFSPYNFMLHWAPLPGTTAVTTPKRRWPRFTWTTSRRDALAARSGHRT